MNKSSIFETILKMCDEHKIYPPEGMSVEEAMGWINGYYSAMLWLKDTVADIKSSATDISDFVITTGEG